ncbi:MAG: ion transporter [Propionibacteriales bacterium]|nr:ion transporter [Propionibacteriales bacterium]
MEISGRRRWRRTDLLVVALALLSVALIAYSVLADLSDRERLTVFWIDLGICVLFLGEFLGSWNEAGWRLSFLWRNWYDVLSMVPVAHPYFIEGDWTRLLWVVVVLARIGRGVDRLVGERVTAVLVSRTTTALVDTIRYPITVAVLDEVTAVLQTGHYTENVANALRENEKEIKSMVREKVKADPLTGRISLLPFHDRMVDTVSETTLRVTFEVLDDPRTDELVADVLRENITQLRDEVRRRGR